MNHRSDHLRGFYAALGAAIRESSFGEVLKRGYSGLHKFVFTVSGGRVWNRMRGGEIILMTSIGCRSGEKRTGPLTSVKVDGLYCVIGSNAGGPRDPAWVSNLRASPQAWLKLPGGQDISVRARPVSDPAEWESIFQRFVAAHDGYATYSATAGRTLPIFVMELF